MRDLQLSGCIESGAEARKGFQLFELGIGQLEITGNSPIGSTLRLAANPRHGLADIDRRQHPQFEENG